MSNAIDTRWETARQDLANAAAKAGIDPGVLAKISGFESQYNPHARPIAGHKHADLNTVTQFDGVKAMSSAYGYGQFTNDTWVGMVRQYGEKYGVANASHLTDAQANAPELRNNTALQAGMLAEFTRNNMAKGAQLGGPDADANVYALHNLGGTAGAKFLTTLHDHPNARIDSVLSHTVIERNPGLYGDGSGTVADAYKVMGQQMARYASYADDIRHVTPGQANPAPIVAPPAAAHATPTHAATTHAPATHAAAPRDVLKEGMHGDDVRALQQQLSRLGYPAAHAAALKPDGHFGPATKAAVEAFQRDHHLSPDGEMGPLTKHQIDNQLRQASHAPAKQAGQATTLLNHPAHPDHAVFQQAMTGVQKVDAQHGRPSDQHSENLAAALTTAARSQGMSRVDHVVMSDDGSRAFGVQGDLNSPFKQIAAVDVGHAVNTPVQQSTEALAQVAQKAPPMPELVQANDQRQQQSMGGLQP